MATTRQNFPAGSGDAGKGFIYDFATDRMVLVGGRTTFSNANYTATAVDRVLAQTGTLSAARVVTLPAANAVPGGTVLQVVDESGTASGTFTISWARAGSDTINGAAGNVVAVNSAYGSGAIESNGASKWTTLGGGAIDLTAVHKGDLVINVKDYGAKGDTKVVADGVISGGSLSTLTCATSTPFVAGDAGKRINVVGAGAAGANLITTIASVTSASVVQLTAAASTAVSAATVVFGTDDTAAFSSAKTAAGVNGKVFVPAGGYMILNVALDVAGQTWELHPGATLRTWGTLSSDYLIRIVANDITLQGGTVDGTGALAAMANIVPVSPNSGTCDGATVRGVTFKNNPGISISCAVAQRLRVEDCRFLNNLGTAIFVNNQFAGVVTRDVIVANNFIDCTGITVPPNDFGGISLWGQSAALPLADVQVTGNVVRIPLPTATAATGPIGYTWGRDFVIANNVCEGGDMGISIPNAVNATLSHNAIRNFLSVGIETPGSATANVTFTGNVIDGTPGSSNQNAVSISQGCTGEVISSNTFRGFSISPGGSYIRCDGVCSQLVISNNVFKDTQGNTGVACIALVPSGTFNACVMAGNSFHGGATGTGNRVLQIEGTVNGLVIDGNQATNLLHSVVWVVPGSGVCANLSVGINSVVNCGPQILYALYGTATMTNFSGPLMRATFSNANYTATPVDSIVAQTGTLSAARVVTLPLANSLPGGTVRQLVDESGTATGTNTLSWARAGADTINGGAGNVVAVNTARGNGKIMSDGASNWTVV